MFLNAKNSQIYHRLIRYIFPFKWMLLVSALASLIVSGSDVVIAYLTKPFVDKLIKEGDQLLMQLLPIGVILLYIIKGLARYAQEYYIKNAGQLAVQDIRNKSFEHLMQLSMRYYSKQQTGTLMSRILSDINVVQTAISNNIIDLIREGLTMFGLIIYAFITDWKMALVTFIVVPAAVGPAASIGRKIKKYSKHSQKAMGTLSSRLQQSISGIKVIKAFGTEKIEIHNFKEENWSLYLYFKKSFRYAAATSPLMEILTSFGVAGALWYGFSRVVAGEITQGELFSIMVAAVMMYGPLKKLVKVNNGMQKAMGAAERIFELLDTEVEIHNLVNAVDLPRVRGTVEFSDVSFAYDNEPVLQNITLRANPGEVVALVGASGAGKSTFVGLLNRFFEPQSGSIKIDGHDISEISLESLHANLALVDQETFLFHDTIYANICYGCTEVTDDQVREAARLAFADEFIELMPEQYQTIIGDRGVRLSGGQRQRICIARAILRDAPILLLDEATSALDTESESMVQNALMNLMKNRTTFVIAHRLSTIMHADRIIVLDHGRIVESGSHKQLLTKNGSYKRLYDVQFRD